MSGFSRAEVIGRPSVCEFLHGPLTSQLAVQSVKQAFNTYVEKHQQILYYRKDGKFFIIIIFVVVVLVVDVVARERHFRFLG